jgi:uncharacterized membrane protein YidH (DUF202 family)
MTVYGAAPERTALAWQRSGLGVVVGCFLVFRTAIGLGATAVAVVAVLLGALVATLLLVVVPSARFRRGHPAGPFPALTTAVLAVVALGLLGGVTAVIVLVRQVPG